MSVREEVYQSPPPAGKGRTLASLQQNSQFSTPKKHLGSKHTPILQMEPTDIIIDELHLLLRIGDVLLRNVILQADNLDRRKHTYYSSNKHDPCGEVIRMERRQDTLQHCKREKRPYHKNDTDYWTSGILEQRKRQRET